MQELKQSSEQVLREAYALEEDLIRKSLSNLSDKQVIDAVNSVARKYYGVEVSNTKDILSLFSRLHSDSFKSRLHSDSFKDTKYKQALYELRRIIYPLIDDKISTPLLSGNLNRLGISRTEVNEMQQRLPRDYNGNRLKADGIFGKRTFSSFLRYLESDNKLQMRPVKTERVSTKGVIYIGRDDLKNYPEIKMLLNKEEAISALGIQYKWGGSNKEGVDCSGLVRYIFGGYRSTTRVIYANLSNERVKDSVNKEGYPRILVRAGTEKVRGHAVIEWGKVNIDGVKYHVIQQAGRFGGIGLPSREVSIALVPEEVYMRVYGDFRILYNADKTYAEFSKDLSMKRGRV